MGGDMSVSMYDQVGGVRRIAAPVARVEIPITVLKRMYVGDMGMPEEYGISLFVALPGIISGQNGTGRIPPVIDPEGILHLGRCRSHELLD